MSNRLYYYNNEWRDFEYLHEYYGMTKSQSTSTYVYDNSLSEHSAWIENDSGHQDYWLAYDEPDIDGRSGVWYTQNDLPYWIKLDTKYKVYLVSQLLQLDTYKKQLSEMYNYNGNLTSFDYMHSNFGITSTPSDVYFVKNNVIKCWYNKDINKYWDADTVRWYDTPPEYDHDSGDINSIGATGLFMYYSIDGASTHYGTLVDGSRLQPISVNVPVSGNVSCERHSIELTGTWKILTETSETSALKPCIVFATKIYNT